MEACSKSNTLSSLFCSQPQTYENARDVLKKYGVGESILNEELRAVWTAMALGQACVESHGCVQPWLWGEAAWTAVALGHPASCLRHYLNSIFLSAVKNLRVAHTRAYPMWAKTRPGPSRSRSE